VNDTIFGFKLAQDLQVHLSVASGGDDDLKIVATVSRYIVEGEYGSGENQLVSFRLEMPDTTKFGELLEMPSPLYYRYLE